MRINHNVSAMTTNNALFQTRNHLGKALEKLSTGLKINRSSDDAAGLSVSENLRSQVRGLHQASKNAQDGINALQVAEGAMNTIAAMLQRMRELGVQAASDLYNTNQRQFLDQEVHALIAEIDRIALSVQFNGQSLLDGTGFGGAQSGSSILQIGANNTLADRLQVNIDTMSTFDIGLTGLANASVNLESQSNAVNALSSIDVAIDSVNQARSDLGAFINRLEHAINVIKNNEVNMQQAEATIRDADMAEEMMEFTKNQILLQAGTAMLAQANQVPQTVLGLFQ